MDLLGPLHTFRNLVVEVIYFEEFCRCIGSINVFWSPSQKISVMVDIIAQRTGEKEDDKIRILIPLWGLEMTVTKLVVQQRKLQLG